jgi:hypothetical protein
MISTNFAVPSITGCIWSVVLDVGQFTEGALIHS